MGLKTKLSVPFARWVISKRDKAYADPVQTQMHEMKSIVAKAKSTAFGIDHDFESIADYEGFKAQVPIRDYEGLANYVDRIKEGERNVLWPGLPLYFCKTSGTTSGTKFIPLTKESLPNHIGSARNALLSYIAETGNADFVNGKMIFLQGSPKLDYLDSGVAYGRLSGIVANHVPAYLQRNRMPSYATNCIEDWETKIDQIVEETAKEDMTLISGIPSWVQMYFEKVIERANIKSVKELFPNFSLFVYGGVNFEPYRNSFNQLIGKEIPSIELYPASEGFIAYQDSQQAKGMLLVINSGIFYEFIPADEFFEESPSRLHLGEVELDVNYVLILNTNAGLWGYNIGDTVKFVSLSPPRIIVSGRIKHFTSAFGEHVIAEEVESCMKQATVKHGIIVQEFHVAPQVSPESGLPYHEWLIEMNDEGVDLEDVAQTLDEHLQRRNTYYKDLIVGNILQQLKITVIEKGGFNAYMDSIGKLGGQNKVPRLSNDRKIADVLRTFKKS